MPNQNNRRTVCLLNRQSQLTFLVKDCFQPFDDDYGQFDFAASFFVVNCCDNEEKLRNFFANIFKVLKPNGKAFITDPPVAANVKDQKTINDLLGVLVPLKSDASGKEPLYWHVPATIVGQPNRGPLFAFANYHWSVKKMIKTLEDVGFINVRIYRPKWSNYVPQAVAEQIEALEKPLIRIVAEKP